MSSILNVTSYLPFDANLARADMLLEIVAEVQVSGGLGEIGDVNHLVSVLGG